MTVKKTRDNSQIGGGKAGPGRPKGVTNKLTAEIKAAIWQGIQAAGDDLSGPGTGAIGWFKHVAKEKPEVMGPIVQKLLPSKVEGGEDGGAPVILVKWDDTKS